jgi:hypothetical protein
MILLLLFIISSSRYTGISVHRRKIPLFWNEYRCARQLFFIKLFEAAKVTKKLDVLAKRQELRYPVIPAKAGIQRFRIKLKDWAPVFTGVTTSCKTIKFHCVMKSLTHGLQGTKFRT